MQQAARVGRRYMVQVKHDGALVRVYLNSRGRIGHVFTRSGIEAPASLTRGLVGALVGAPHAELVGELTAYTEAGNRITETLGHRQIHLFDCLHDGTRSLTGAPYHARRDALYRMQSALVGAPTALPWKRDRTGRAHAKDGTFTEAIPTDWRLTPIVEQWPISKLEELWGELVERDGQEGLVLVAQDAPLGRRRSKLKLKKRSTLDAVAVAVTPRTVTCSWAGQLFNVGRGKHDVSVGAVVECAFSGFYETVTIPRFPSLVRVREELRP